MENLKLLGVWSSPFSCRVIWALELKGIKYDYIEEDLTNKSSLLLQSNPVHKKIPVLIHNGKPVCESLIILEYLEEVRPHQYPLFPKEPYERAKARFWSKFAEDKGIAFWMFVHTTGDEQAKAKKDSIDMLRTLEEHGDLQNNTFFGGEEIGIPDLTIGSLIYWLQVIEQVFEVKFFEATTFPNLFNWFNNFKDVPIIKKNSPDQHKLCLHFKKLRQNKMEAK